MHRIFVALMLSLVVVWGCSSSETKTDGVTASIDGGSEDLTGLTTGKAPKEKHPPTVRIETTAGSMTIVLDADKAPLTVRNFLAYVEAGHYDQTIFHQVVDGYMILGGGFDNKFQEKTGQEPIRNEAHNGVPNRRGSIAMARQADAIDSSTCQFFINLADNADLDHKDRDAPENYGYCVFGQVTEGLEVAEKIGKGAVQNRESFEPVQPVAIRNVKRIR